MKKTQLYTLTLIAVSIVVLLISIASSYYLYNASKDKLWEAKLESGEREAREIANLLEQQLNSGLNQQQVIQNLQKSIENTDFKSDFICMYNQKGIELCHPNPSFIGKVIEDDNSDLIDIKNNKNNTFRKVLEAGKKDNGLRTFSKEKQRNSEIVNVYPVPKTDWMVASHANLKVMQEQLSDLFLQFLLSLLLSTLIITISCYVLIRLIYKKYESNMELEIVQLNNEVNELQILNKQLNSYQEKLQTIPDNQTDTTVPDNSETAKKRIITYHKDELVKLETTEIAYIFLDNGITNIYTFNNRQFTSNNSLDEIMKWLDNSNFYRANRQYIINIEVIQTILLYGKNQLKLKLKTTSTNEIVISKNKVAEFKQWLDQ